MLENSSQEVLFCVKNLQLSEGGKFVVATVNSINGEEQPIFLIVLSLPAPQPALTLAAQEPQRGPTGPAGDLAVSQAAEGEVRESAAGAGRVREGLSGESI